MPWRYRWLARLRGSTLAATTVEFALVAPTFIFMVLGLMESCRLMWMTQTAQTVAYSAARCQAIGTNCPNAAAVRGYVQRLARQYAIAVDPLTVVATTKTTCHSYAGSSLVQFTLRYHSAMADLVPLFPKTKTVTGCFLQI